MPGGFIMHHRRTPLITLALVLFASAAFAQDITLPAPKTDGGKPLMQVLKERHSTREFGSEKLAPQVLSNLLWAAFGLNRADGHRTAPSAMNWQEIDLYVATADGAYLWDPKANVLKLVAPGDLRGATGNQAYVGTAAINLVYVADMAKTGRATPEQQIWVWANTGFIAQNAYLFCSSEGLVVVVRALLNRETLGPQLKLRPDQKIILAQSIGYPKAR
jgi:nitroreductase